MDARGSGCVLVTGGNGFIGSCVARTLAEQDRSIRVLDERPVSVANRFVLGEHAERIAVEIGSVADWGRCAEAMHRHRPTQVVHLAVAGAPFSKDLHANLSVNVIATVNVVEFARLLGVERVVLFSSEVVVPTARYTPVDPAHPVILPRQGPRGGFYGASKLANEAFGFAYRDNYGLDTRIVRPTAVYGQGMAWQTYVKVMVEGAVRGEAVQFQHGASFAMDYTHVEDVALLAVMLLDAPADVDNVFYSSTGGAAGKQRRDRQDGDGRGPPAAKLRSARVWTRSSAARADRGRRCRSTTPGSSWGGRRPTPRCGTAWRTTSSATGRSSDSWNGHGGPQTPTDPKAPSRVSGKE